VPILLVCMIERPDAVPGLAFVFCWYARSFLLRSMFYWFSISFFTFW
jgi:hypothetical protein